MSAPAHGPEPHHGESKKSHGPSHSVIKGVCSVFSAMSATVLFANSFDDGGGGGHDHGHH